jgi:hypothetical protein
LEAYQKSVVTALTCFYTKLDNNQPIKDFSSSITNLIQALKKEGTMYTVEVYLSFHKLLVASLCNYGQSLGKQFKLMHDKKSYHYFKISAQYIGLLMAHYKLFTLWVLSGSLRIQ